MMFAGFKLVQLYINCSKWVLWMWNVSNYQNVTKYTCGYCLLTCMDLRGNDFIHPYENPCHTSWLWQITFETSYAWYVGKILAWCYKSTIWCELSELKYWNCDLLVDPHKCWYLSLLVFLAFDLKDENGNQFPEITGQSRHSACDRSLHASSSTAGRITPRCQLLHHLGCIFIMICLWFTSI